MKRSRFGFSERRSQSTASFNPVVGSSNRSEKARDIKAAKFSTKYRYTPRFILGANVAVGMILDKRVGHTEIVVEDRHKARKSPFHEEWFGVAQIRGERFPFRTDRHELEINERYHVVYEKIETITGDSGIKIHDVIS